MKRINLIFCILSCLLVVIFSSSCQISFTEHQHDFSVTTISATCLHEGYDVHVCDCGTTYRDNFVHATEHKFAEDANEHFCYGLCLNNCGTFMNKQDTTFEDSLVITYNTVDGITSSDIDELYQEIMDELAKFEDYDESIHKYDVNSELYVTSQEFIELFNNLNSILKYLRNEKEIGECVLTLVAGINEDFKSFKEVCNALGDVDTKIKDLYNVIYQKSLREYFFSLENGWTQEMIDKLNNSNAEYINQLEAQLEVLKMTIQAFNDTDIMNDDFIEYYSEFVSVANRIAIEGYGYSNYFDYAYKEIYYRDYTFSTISDSMQDLKRLYFTINELIRKQSLYLNSIMNDLPEETLNLIESISTNSVLTDANLLRIIGDYYQYIQSVNDTPLYNYDEFLEGILANKQYLYTPRAQAYSHYVSDTAFMCLGSGNYSNSMTFVHELGHTLDRLYQVKNYDAPIETPDICEYHSQTNEFFFTDYLSKYVDSTAARFAELSNLSTNLYTIPIGCIMAEFEYEVYKADAEGHPLKGDEFKQLFVRIANEFGLDESKVSNYSRFKEYWRTIVRHSTCYYISYGFSLISSLKSYVKCLEEGIDSAIIDYNKVLMYRDIDRSRIVYANETYDYAGIGSPFDKEGINHLIEFFENRYNNIN